MRRRGKWVSAIAALAIALGAAAFRGGFGANDAAGGFRAWSDALFIAGVFVGGVGLLAFASSGGLFDVIRFGVGKALRVVLSRERREAYPKTFYDYRMLKRGDGPGGTSAIVAGLACIALGGVFLALYLNAAG